VDAGGKLDLPVSGGLLLDLLFCLKDEAVYSYEIFYCI
jgi:hypothetical protein